MQGPFFSIIMPVYNAGAYLPAAVSSVLNQSEPDFELIFVDDGSTDKSPAVCARAAADDQRVVLLQHAQNLGLSAARNTGLSKARGAYVLFMDADDELYSDALSKIKAAIAGFMPDVVVFGLTERYLDAAGPVLYEKQIVPDKRSLETTGAVRGAVMELERDTLFGYAWNKAYRRELLTRSDALFENVTLIEDFLFNLRVVALCERAEVLSEALYLYNIKAAGNLTARFLPDYFPLNHRRVAELYSSLSRWGCLTDEAERELARIYVRYAFSALARNGDPRTGMSRAARREWLAGLYRDELFESLRGSMGACGSFAARGLGRLFAAKRSAALLLAAKFTYIVKARLPGAFARIKQR